MDSNRRTIWIADAHRGDGKRFLLRADEKLTAFLDSCITKYENDLVVSYRYVVHLFEGCSQRISVSALRFGVTLLLIRATPPDCFSAMS